ncbi:J domain-containing protein [Risungbinella massiliensis]|uniref:J domain-containing protein n=1 Tax=Risungbinella massiliensis TaxID=1329796 RepID=UPI0005CC1FEB|nr:J domain-containing protein [Risungbinella massiliensis]
MTIWKILGIEPTENLSVIKRAYAKKLKVHHPEDDPEGYQKLREAYDSAIKQAKMMLVQPASLEYEEPDEVELEEALPNRINLTSDIDFDSQPKHPLDVFMQEVEELYADFFSRINSDKWKKLLDSDIVWNVEQNEALQDRLIYFLEDHHYLPQPIWELFDSMFHWSDQENELDHRYDEEFIEYVRRQINGTREMRYDFFKKIDNLDYEEFLELREKAQSALMINDLDDAKDYLDEAFQLYPDDPDLLLMQGSYYLRNKDTDQALESFNHVLRIHPDDLDARKHRARIRYNSDQFSKAIEDCEHILSLLPENTDALSLIGKSYMKLGDIENAKQRFTKVLELDLFHIEARILLNEISNPTTSGIKPTNQKNQWISTLFYYLLMLMRRSWVYVLPYFILTMIIPDPYDLLLLIPFLWEAWKSYRTFVF